MKSLRAMLTTAVVWATALGAVCFGPSEYVVRVKAGPSAATPVFDLPPAGTPLYGLVVARCGEKRPVWEIGTGGGDVSRPTSITYGTAPDGFKTRVAPAALTPGCYAVFASRDGTGHFTLRPDGTLGR